MRLHQFSEENNLRGITEETLVKVSQELKIACWNIIVKFTEPAMDRYTSGDYFKHPLFVHALGEFFSMPNDIYFPNSTAELQTQVRPQFFNINAQDFYDLLNFLSLRSNGAFLLISQQFKKFSDLINEVLIAKGSPCRFVNTRLTILTSAEQLTSIQTATTTPYETVNKLILQAASKLYHGNWREACVDAISAVEVLLKNIFNIQKEDFSKLVDKLNIDGGLKASIKSMWGYLSNRVRHLNGDFHQNYLPNEADAKLIVVWCSALICYLKEPLFTTIKSPMNKENAEENML